jgi:azurin
MLMVLPITSLAHSIQTKYMQNIKDSELMIHTKYMQGSGELRIPFHTDKEAHILLNVFCTFVGRYLSESANHRTPLDATILHLSYNIISF